jgi:hypothetical protein
LIAVKLICTVFQKGCETVAFQYSSIRQIKTESKMVCSIEKSVAAIMGAARIFSGGRGQNICLGA